MPCTLKKPIECPNKGCAAKKAKECPRKGQGCALKKTSINKVLNLSLAEVIDILTGKA
jgi:hypothetical protein